MSPEKQRIAIATAYGYYKVGASNCWAWKLNGEDVGTGDWALPDYLNDRNAMAEAEKVLTDTDDDEGSRWRFIQELIEITKAESMEVHREVFVVAHATAAQRAEAFLRTLGKWEESK